jgi:hypothetical protein
LPTSPTRYAPVPITFGHVVGAADLVVAISYFTLAATIASLYISRFLYIVSSLFFRVAYSPAEILPLARISLYCISELGRYDPCFAYANVPAHHLADSALKFSSHSVVYISATLCAHFLIMAKGPVSPPPAFSRDLCIDTACIFRSLHIVIREKLPVISAPSSATHIAA